MIERRERCVQRVAGAVTYAARDDARLRMSPVERVGAYVVAAIAAVLLLGVWR